MLNNCDTKAVTIWGLVGYLILSSSFYPLVLVFVESVDETFSVCKHLKEAIERYFSVVLFITNTVQYASNFSSRSSGAVLTLHVVLFFVLYNAVLTNLSLQPPTCDQLNESTEQYFSMIFLIYSTKCYLFLFLFLLNQLINNLGGTAQSK